MPVCHIFQAAADDLSDPHTPESAVCEKLEHLQRLIIRLIFSIRMPDAHIKKSWARRQLVEKTGGCLHITCRCGVRIISSPLNHHVFHVSSSYLLAISNNFVYPSLRAAHDFLQSHWCYACGGSWQQCQSTCTRR
jgi:hypothetical protein